jgi:hypothetical protein
MRILAQVEAVLFQRQDQMFDEGRLAPLVGEISIDLLKRDESLLAPLGNNRLEIDFLSLNE